MLLQKLTVFSAGLLVISCGVSFDKKDSKTTKKESLSYQYELNGCNTGKHTFNDHAAYCRGLMDDALNNHCAKSLRSADFEKNCPPS